MVAIRLVTTVWGDPLPLDRACAKKLHEYANAQYADKRKKGDKISSRAMYMLDQFVMDQKNEISGPRELTYEYLADRTMMSVSSVKRSLKDLVDSGLIEVIRSPSVES